MQIYPMAIAGSAVVITVTLLIVTVMSRVRLRRVLRELEQRRQDDELDRHRIRSTLERSQLEASNANGLLTDTRAECDRLRQDLSQQEALAKETLKKFAEAHERVTALQDELRIQRTQIDRAATAQAELSAERKLLEETKKALTSARVHGEKLGRDSTEAKRLLTLERTRVSEKEKLLEQAQSEIAKHDDDLGKLTTKLNAATERLQKLERLETKTAELTARNAELERELSSVIQVASTVNAVELDRDELQVRLETAAYSVRIARKEADRFRASTEHLQTETDQLRSELSKLQSLASDRERLSSENTKLVSAQSRHTQLLHSMQNRLDEAARNMQAAETRADEVSTEQQRITRALEDSELERRELRARLESLGQAATQLEQLRKEVSLLSKADSKRQTAEAEVASLTSELRASQATLRNAQANVAELERLRNTVQLLQEEQRSHLEAEQRLLALQAELRSYQGGVAAAHEKRMEVEQLERLRDENQKLRDDIARLREYEKASLELEQLASEHKRVRLEAELLTRRVHELTTLQEELDELRRQSVEHRQLKLEASYLTEAMGQLEAQLYALGHVPQTKRISTSILPTAIGTKAHEIETQLSPMLERTKLRSVVLADASGFQVVATGDTLAQEGLAAYSALASQLAQRARRLLPIGDVLVVNLVDSNHLIVSCRLFSVGREEFAVATIGPEQLDLPITDEVVQALRQSMTSKHEVVGTVQAASE